MTDPQARLGERCAEAVDALGHWAAELEWSAVSFEVRKRLNTVLFDILAANAVGARTAAQQAIRETWYYPPGHSPVINPTGASGLFTDTATAAFLNGQAVVCLELDEGNKYAKGHPAAHVFPAVLSLATELDVAGPTLSRALLIGYEIAARFGQASTPIGGAHPHGSWAIAGAAAGCAQLLGLDAEGTAAAIDTGSGMPIAGHFDSALDGNPVRDSWVGAANQAGIVAARLAAAGTARNTGTAAGSLGNLLGTFDPALLGGHGERYAIERNYFKQHSACSYTHPVADLGIQARHTLFGPDTCPNAVADEVTEVRVSTHALAAQLNRTSWHNPLSAMFSIPFVAAAALLEGTVSPRVTALRPSTAPLLAKLARSVRVTEDEHLTRLLPDQRGARVTVRLRDGRLHTLEAPNPIGDSDFTPFDRTELSTIFDRLLGADAGALNTLHTVVNGLDAATNARSLLAPLAGRHDEHAAEER